MPKPQHHVSLLPRPTSYGYDDLYRLIQVTDAFNQTIAYGYDAASRIIAVSSGHRGRGIGRLHHLRHLAERVVAVAGGTAVGVMHFR